MPEISKNNFYFLNRDGVWPGFKRHGLELRKDGVLQLSSLPKAMSPIPDSVKSAEVPTGPAGLAFSATGTLFYSDPDHNRVSQIVGYDNSVSPVPCMGGAMGGPTSLSAPRGLVISPTRDSLFVVDSGNHCVKIFTLDTFQLVGIWGQPNLAGIPQPSSLPGRFNTPWTAAADSSGNLYVVDYGNQRVQKFSPLGDVIPAFCTNIQSSGLVHQPADVAILDRSGKTWVLVVDVVSSSVFVFDSNGYPVLDAAGSPLCAQDSHLTQPLGIAADGHSIYIGDNRSKRVLRFQIEDTFEYVGAAVAYQGPVAALLLDGKGGLWVHSADGLTPTKLSTSDGYTTLGSMWLDPAKPLHVDDRSVVWHRLQALAGSLPANAHLDLYAYASDDLSKAPAVDPNATNPFSDSKWQTIRYAGNVDVKDLYIGGSKAKYLWVGALFSGDGVATTLLRQLRVEFDYPTYEQYLPAVYRNNANCGEFLARLLSLFQSFFSGVEYEIDSLPALFDPHATPKAFLSWLAGCLGFEIDDNWSEEKQREIIARIFGLSGRRGTAAGLRDILRLLAGVDAIIEEPLLNASWWSLPSRDACCDECASSCGMPEWEREQNSRLGWTTMLAPAQPQGAVVGTSAVLDQSHLITDGDFGAPLFTDVAYQFCVMVYRSQVMGPESIANLRRIIEQEKPAHAAYELCIIDPLFRVGFQSRVGIDSVVAGAPRSLALGSDRSLGVDSALAGPPPSSLGPENRLGISTRLG